METKDKAFGAGIIFYAKNPKRVILSVRDQKHPNPAKTLPYPGMLDIIGGHMEKLGMFTMGIIIDCEENGIEYKCYDVGDGLLVVEHPLHCIKRELAEEWLDLRTGRPYELKDFHFFEQFENDDSVQ